MELKNPTKKGIKTPRYRPPLPILNESPSGYCVDEYDWPLFNGYYNGTSVIVDDPQAINLLANKGFFGKGSLSKGCPNVFKRKIPSSVVYESQWKRRKSWMQSLNLLLVSREKTNEIPEGRSADVNSIESNDAEKMEVDNEKNCCLQNNLCSAEQTSSNKNEDGVNETSQNRSNGTCQNDLVEIDTKKTIEEGKTEINNDKNIPLQNNSGKTEEEVSNTSSKENNLNAQNKCEIEKKNNDEVEKMEIVQEQNNLFEIIEQPSNGTENEESVNSVETSQDNIVDIGNKKSNDVEIIDVDIEKNYTKKSSCIPKDNGESKVLGTGVNMNQNTKEPECQNNETSVIGNVSNSPVENTDIDVKEKDKEKIDDNHEVKEETISSKVVNNKSKCVRKINNTEKGTLNMNEVLVIPDIDGDLEQYFLNLKPSIQEEKVKTVIEVLYLSLEEAFFLSYCCNCLQIIDLTSNILSIRDIWILFQESQADFIEKYVAYHYFRAKGWVVKAGTKFGGDFLLYKKGPLYYHASYIVIVEVIKNDKNSRNKTTWQKIVGMNRMAESANKEILICHVLRPEVEEEKFNDPAILKEFGVFEMLLRRWQATQEKT